MGADDDGMRAEYDFSTGVRGKHAAAYGRGRRLTVLEPDVARAFKDPREVTDVLRALARILRAHRKRPRK